MLRIPLLSAVTCALMKKVAPNHKPFTSPTIGPDCPLILRTDENGVRIPYVQIEKNLEVRLTRTHFYMLAEYAVEDPEDPSWLGIWSQGAFYRLGHMDDS